MPLLIKVSFRDYNLDDIRDVYLEFRDLGFGIQYRFVTIRDLRSNFEIEFLKIRDLGKPSRDRHGIIGIPSVDLFLLANFITK